MATTKSAKIEAERAKRREERNARQAVNGVDNAERAKALEEKRRLIREKYGFTPGKKPATPEEIEGFKRWQRDQEAEYRKRHHDKITAYNREYRRRKRAEALAKQQTTWTPEQWDAWKKQQESKARGTPAWLIREVVKYLAGKENLPEDDVVQWIMENDGIDFLTRGAESIGMERLRGKAAIPMAARALMFYIDPERATLFPPQGESTKT